MTTELVLKKFALQIRLGIVEAIASKGGGHIGGSLDLAELLSVLYSDFLRVDPNRPDWDGRDFLICSKGHAGPALYSVLALKGFFPYERLSTLNRENTTLPGHCDRMKVPGIDATTGSLGQGLSIASGVALGLHLKKTEQRVFCILGDGELAEGQNWEAAQFAAHHGLDNLIAFLDWNKMQIDGRNDRVMSLKSPVAKFSAFGWNSSLVSGGDVLAIQQAVADALEKKNGQPSMIVLDTIKGAGVSCVSELPNNHCIGFPKALCDKAIEELTEQGSYLGMEVKKCL